MTNAYNPGSRFSLRSSYGKRIDPMTGLPGKFHSGLDFAAPAGTPIPTAASGYAMGIDPQILMQPAPSPDHEYEQDDLRTLEARLSNSGNIMDALALYNARRSNWG